MNIRRPVAVPFEVSRHATFFSKSKEATMFTERLQMEATGDPHFSGSIALHALREAWTDLQTQAEGTGNSLSGLVHPQLSPMKVPLLHRSEVEKGLFDGFEDGQPVYNRRKASRLRRQLGKVLRGAPMLRNLRPPVTVAVEKGIDRHPRIIMPLVSQEVGAAAIALRRERAKYLEVLHDVTDVTVQEPFHPSLMIARLGLELTNGQREELYLWVQRAVSDAEQRDLDAYQAGESQPLHNFHLAPPEIIE